jgi:hypothetical protein
VHLHDYTENDKWLGPCEQERILFPKLTDDGAGIISPETYLYIGPFETKGEAGIALFYMGGEEILRQLRSLGEEGERSAQRLQLAFGSLTLGNNFATQFARLRKSFADLGQAGTRIATSFSGLTRGLSDVATAFSYTTGHVCTLHRRCSGSGLSGNPVLCQRVDPADEGTDRGAW